MSSRTRSSAPAHPSASACGRQSANNESSISPTGISRRSTAQATSHAARAASAPPRPRAYTAARGRRSSAPMPARNRTSAHRPDRPGRDTNADMPQTSSSTRAQSARPRVGCSDTLLCSREPDHALDLRGCPFLVCKRSYERPVADGAIVAIGREPGVPRPRDPLRRPPTLLELRALLWRRLGDPRVAVVSDAGVGLTGSVSSRTEEHVPHSKDGDVDSTYLSRRWRSAGRTQRGGRSRGCRA